MKEISELINEDSKKSVSALQIQDNNNYSGINYFSLSVMERERRKQAN